VTDTFVLLPFISVLILKKGKIFICCLRNRFVVCDLQLRVCSTAVYFHPILNNVVFMQGSLCEKHWSFGHNC